jgi:hypothetical protein
MQDLIVLSSFLNVSAFSSRPSRFRSLVSKDGNNQFLKSCFKIAMELNNVHERETATFDTITVRQQNRNVHHSSCKSLLLRLALMWLSLTSNQCRQFLCFSNVMYFFQFNMSYIANAGTLQQS